MVYWNNSALDDLDGIYISLLNWQTPNGQKRLSYVAIVAYIRDLRRAFNRIDKLPFHHQATYSLHKMFGEYVYTYKRNARTSWYACYDVLQSGVFLNKIMNNYLTLF